jgi:hypothetical protein
VKLKHDAFFKSGEYEIMLQNMLDEMARGKVKKEEVEEEEEEGRKEGSMEKIVRDKN